MAGRVEYGGNADGQRVRRVAGLHEQYSTQAVCVVTACSDSSLGTPVQRVRSASIERSEEGVRARAQAMGRLSLHATRATVVRVPSDGVILKPTSRRHRILQR